MTEALLFVRASLVFGKGVGVHEKEYHALKREGASIILHALTLFYYCL